MAWLGLVVVALVLVAVIALLLNRFLDDKIFLASLVVLLGALKEAFSRLVDSQSSKLLASVEAYPGSKYEHRLVARHRDIKLLQDLSFWSLLAILTAVAFFKAVTAGGGE
jgi:hypothetical protein